MIKLNNSNVNIIVIVFSILMLIATFLTFKEYFTTNTPSYTTSNTPSYTTSNTPSYTTSNSPSNTNSNTTTKNTKNVNLRFLKSFGKEPFTPVPYVKTGGYNKEVETSLVAKMDSRINRQLMV